MVNEFHQRAITDDRIVAKVFGGASVFNYRHDGKTVGANNYETAMRLIDEKNIKLVQKNIGGNRGRELYLFSDTGEVYISPV